MHPLIRNWILRGFLVVLGLVVLLVLLLAGLAFWPLDTSDLVFESKPLKSYAEGQAMVEALKDESPEGIRPECEGTLLDHGHQTEDVYVLMHGLTNCPKQFQALGQILFDQGANVIIPRTPYHGFLEEYADSQRLLTAQAILQMANLAVDAAHALGKRVTVIGLSVNGTTAAWLAQNRSDIDRVVLISPFLAPHGINEGWIAPVCRLIARLPNKLIWWDADLKEQLEGPDYAYPQFATHPIAHVLRIGLDVFGEAREQAPKAGSMLLVTSAADTAINVEHAEALMEIWAEQVPGKISTYQFPLEEGIPHDCIDPNQPGANPDLVYPKLLELIAAMP